LARALMRCASRDAPHKMGGQALTAPVVTNSHKTTPKE
jgi:hypothetical protein